MADHHATVRWTRGAQPFTNGVYSRAHEWRFDGGAVVRASASPSIVRAPMSDAAAVDPEEAFVVSLSSCHMLWFLSLAAKAGLVVDAYADDAVGRLDLLADGRSVMALVLLRPTVIFGGTRRPSNEEVTALHAEAHRQCFLANAVKCDVHVEPAA